MKRIGLLLCTLMCISTLALRAQYIINPDLPVPATQPATDVSEYGFNANWQTVSDVQGYLIKTYVSHKATADGETFDFINTDFDFIETDRTTEDPDDNGTTENGMVIDFLKEPSRGNWKTVNAVYAKGVLGINNAWYAVLANGAILSPILDLDKGGGKVHVHFRLKGDSNAHRLVVYLRNTDVMPNEVIDSDTISVTTDWVDHKITLSGGKKHCDIMFMGLDAGNQKPLYYFFDKLRVYQELQAGDEPYAPYSDSQTIDPLATRLYVNTIDLAPGEEYSFSVSSSAKGEVSPESLKRHLTGRVESNEQISPLMRQPVIILDGNTLRIEGCEDPSNVSVYDLSGLLIDRGRTSVALPGVGTYLVSIGGYTYKVLYID